MVENYVAPIDHSTGSAAASTVGGAASGALVGGARSFWKGIKTLAIVGGVLAAGVALFSTGLITIPAAVAGAAANFVMPAFVGQLLSVVGWGAVGTVAGAAVGVAAGWITVPVGGLIGGAKGAAHAAHKVNEERGAAAQVQAQIDMIRAQSQPAPVTNVYAPTAANNNTGFPPHGDMMNAAAPQISNMQYDGLMSGQQLAAAR